MILDNFIFQLAAIVVGAGLLATLFLFARQPIILAYIAVGVLIGPNGLALMERADHIEQIAHLGVVLLLFLVGLNLQPKKLIQLFGKTSMLTLGTSSTFGVISFLFAQLAGYNLADSLIIGAAMMFSSTVVALKLIPTTTLHHKHTGEVMTSVLLLQDILAIIVLLLITGETAERMLPAFVVLVLKLSLLGILAFAAVRFLIIPLLRKFGAIQEYIFLITLAWCLLVTEAAHELGLSYEMGAFIGGVSVASSSVALVIAEHLKPLREFFLILFFFSIGAKLEIPIPGDILFSSLLLGVLLVLLKAYIFRRAFIETKESQKLSTELGIRLGQASEFSILIAFTGLSAGALSANGAMFIQITTLVTFVISTYWVVLKYPTPVSIGPKLRQD
ncbi:MAG: cation:proton antiporter [Gammaproteobacteria bacterium]|nr:cation:proton antiporter [Gammaproteobacteria bacterium]